ncbi:hypothetical protein [Acholeplasma oculi]|nr:hypothetical protein [Acholeplasma oculi]
MLKSFRHLEIYSLVINRIPTKQDKLDLEILVSTFKSIPKASLNYLILLLGLSPRAKRDISFLISQIQGSILTAITLNVPLKPEAFHRAFKEIGKHVDQDVVNKMLYDISQE